MIIQHVQPKLSELLPFVVLYRLYGLDPLNAYSYEIKSKALITYMYHTSIHFGIGAPVAQWVKRWPTYLADRVRSSLEVKSSQP